jgi:hypothetical protein
VKVAVALLSVLIVGAISGFMYPVTTFLFNFSSGQAHMGPIVQYGALAAVALSLVIAAIVWKVRSPTAAALSAAIGTPVVWVVAVFVEWGLSFEFGVG